MADLNTSSNTALVFMTNKKDRETMERLRTIVSQVHSIASCYVLLDAGTADIQETWQSFLHDCGMESVALVPFEISRVSAELAVPLYAPGRMNPGSTHYPLIWLSQKLNHKFFWFTEDDVVYTGDWRDIIQLFEADSSDLICSHISRYSDIPDWIWWKTLKAPAAALKGSSSVEMVRRGFFPIYRISARALSTLLEYQRAGWAGYFEVLVPTILRYAGYSIRDFNDETKTLYKKGAPRGKKGAPGLSSLRFRPPVHPSELSVEQLPLIFHPVKITAKETSAAERGAMNSQ